MRESLVSNSIDSPSVYPFTPFLYLFSTYDSPMTVYTYRFYSSIIIYHGNSNLQNDMKPILTITNEEKNRVNDHAFPNIVSMFYFSFAYTEDVDIFSN